MERLTKTSDKGGAIFTFDLDIICRPSEAQKILKLAERLKTYEDAEEQGLLLRLPCKVGTPVYMVAEDCGGDTLDCRRDDCQRCDYLCRFVEENTFDAYMIDGIGKTVFLTKEEAEQALARMEGANDGKS